MNFKTACCFHTAKHTGMPSFSVKLTESSHKSTRHDHALQKAVRPRRDRGVTPRKWLAAPGKKESLLSQLHRSAHIAEARRLAFDSVVLRGAFRELFPGFFYTIQPNRVFILMLSVVFLKLRKIFGFHFHPHQFIFSPLSFSSYTCSIIW